MTTCLCNCFNAFIYSNVNEWVRKACFDVILDDARRNIYNDTIAHVEDMIYEMGDDDELFYFIEWEQPLVALVESIFEGKWSSEDRSTDFLAFLDFFGWLLFIGTRFFYLKNGSFDPMREMLYRIIPRLCEVINEERNQVAKIVEEPADSELRGIGEWIGHSHAVADAICKVLRDQVYFEWEDASTAIADIFKDQNNGNLLASKERRQQLLLTAFLDLWIKFDMVFTRFPGHAKWSAKIKNEFRSILNLQIGDIITPELMVDYCILLLGKMEFLTRRKLYITLFEVADFFEDEEAFKIVLQTKLSHHLISCSPSVIKEYEKRVNELKNGTKTLLATDVGRMLIDAKNWNEDNKGFIAWVNDKRYKSEGWTKDYARLLTGTIIKENYHIRTVRSASWLTETDTDLRIPNSLCLGMSLFERYFEERYSARNFKWSKSLGRTSIRTSFFALCEQEAVTLNLSIAQVCVLNLFQEIDELTVEEILEKLLPERSKKRPELRLHSEKLIIATLKSLSSIQYPLLEYSSDMDLLHKTEFVKLNMGFRSAEKKIVLPRPDEFVLETDLK